MKYLLLFLLAPVCCVAQQQSNLRNAILKLNLIAAADVNTFPTLQLAYEKQVAKYISLQGEAGYQQYSFFKNDTSFVHPSGFKANVELRFYNITPMRGRQQEQPANLTGLYAAVNLFYRQSKDNRALLYYHKSDSIPLKDYFYGTKKVFGANALLGYQHDVSKRLVLDFYAGIGIINRTAREHNLDYNAQKDVLTNAIDVNVNDALNNSYRSKYNGWMANVSVGIRLGLRL